MKTFKNWNEACWKGYKQIGMKKKGGKKVPSCVPEEEEIEEDSVKKVTSGEFAGRYMVKYIWNRRKETGIFDTKADAIKHAQLIRKTKGAKLDEAIEGLKNKAEKSGMPYGILKKVYDRGMAAYKTGHRPGTTAQQWAFARVNSFVTKSKGTWGGADKDLAAKVRG